MTNSDSNVNAAKDVCCVFPAMFSPFRRMWNCSELHYIWKRKSEPHAAVFLALNSNEAAQPFFLPAASNWATWNRNHIRRVICRWKKGKHSSLFFTPPPAPPLLPPLLFFTLRTAAAEPWFTTVRINCGGWISIRNRLVSVCFFVSRQAKHRPCVFVRAGRAIFTRWTLSPRSVNSELPSKSDNAWHAPLDACLNCSPLASLSLAP